jgi:diguanylate cyclase (GGDEF)-like protein
MVAWRTRRLGQRQAELEALVAERTRELAVSHEAMRLLALKDALTQTWNRRAVMEMLERELARCTREGQVLTVVMVDADHFKGINDRHGHPAGDLVLREIARRLQACTRSYDVLGRYGGEEFMLLLPDLSCLRAEGRKRIEAFHQAIGEAPMVLEDGTALRVTCSFGAATLDTGRGDTAKALVARADEALYAAKTAGRNRVVFG